MKINWKSLERRARAQAKQAYAPYSGYKFGVALLGCDGNIYCGSNVENASYGLSICAERCAVCSAVAAGCRKFVAMVLYFDKRKVLSPCGACRQFMAEFSRDMPILMVCKGSARATTTVAELLPLEFAAPDLKKASC